jgi:integrase/recombinase XerD
MTRSTGKRRYHIKNTRPTDPNVLPIMEWSQDNRECYLAFRSWLQDARYSQSTIQPYLVGARYVLGFLKKPYWDIDPEREIEGVWKDCQEEQAGKAKRESYRKGLHAFRQYLYEVQNVPIPPKPIHWPTYLKGLPGEIATILYAYIEHRRRKWTPDRQHDRTITLLSHLTHSIRWIKKNLGLVRINDITPRAWYAYRDSRLADGISPITLNGELKTMRGFLLFAQRLGMPICERFLHIRELNVGPRIPKDVPLEQVCSLLAEIDKIACSTGSRDREKGLMDRAWCLLMLYSGLRVGEIRRLRLQEIDFDSKIIRIQQSKGQQDRIVFFSDVVSDALKAYLAVRGSKRSLRENVFLVRNKPLSISYCGHRLRSYGKQCGVHITPHQLRHTCATLLLNEKVPVVSIQKILGHQRVETTMGYARLYDATVAEDYFRAMEWIERISPSKT